MSLFHPSPYLRRALLADAVTSGAVGLALVLAAGPLGGLFGLPSPMLTYAGIVLLPFAALVAYLALRSPIPEAAVWAVILVNVLWAADSLLLLVSGWVEPTRPGFAFVAGQAAVVALYAELQWVGLRQSKVAVA